MGNGLDVVIDADEFEVIVVEYAVAGARIAVAGLTDGAGVDDAFFMVIEAVDAFHIAWGIEVGFVGEDAWDVSVADEAAFFDAIEDLGDFGRSGDDVIGKEIFIDGTSGRGVDPEGAFLFDADLEGA